MAGVAVAGGGLLALLGTYPLVQVHSDPLPEWGYLLPMTLAGAGLYLRRRAPLWCLTAGAVGFAVDVAMGASLATALIFTQVLYEVCLHGPRDTWRWLLRVSVTLIVTGTVTLFVLSGSWRGAGWIALSGTLVLLFPTITGLSVRQYRDQAEAERARAEHTARLADLDRQQVVTAERHRMARELHDVISNHLSAVAIHATAAQAAHGTDEATVRAALAMIRESGVQGLAEMRQMVRLLRDPQSSAPGRVPNPIPDAVAGRLAETDRLVTAARSAGLKVRFWVEGTPLALPWEVDLAAYRILQESLTNARKHGAGSVATARISYREDGVEVSVENPIPRPAGRRTEHEPDRGAADSANAVATSGGAGLIGMRERALLLNGSFHAGAVEDTWLVRAVLTTGGNPPAGASATVQERVAP